MKLQGQLSKAMLLGVLVGISIGTITTAIAFKNRTVKPEIFDSLLCSKHKPTGAILINTIKCTDGSIWRLAR